ncbi:MAG: histidinol-phosphatase [Defluviicoccus sp.]|nr:histidinol-phosphatase [Defluviicoccus sp.]MDG4609553.1 histidinol-phosphatase [Defluviicoccus sp.]
MDRYATFAVLAQDLADAVRPLVLRHFRTGLGFEIKADQSPVTIADREAEAAMRRMIEAAYPEHGIFGEEHGVARADASFVWVLDPIDGTKAFVTGKPLFGTLIALLHEGRPVVGVIDMPALNERWVGVAGQETLYNSQPVRVRSCGGLEGAWLYATSPQMFQGADASAFERLRTNCYASVYGADCYAYGLLSCGWVDLVCEASTQAYDYCALVPVIEGASGVITDWQGKPLGLGSDGRVLAAGDPALHAAAQRALAG